MKLVLNTILRSIKKSRAIPTAYAQLISVGFLMVIVPLGTPQLPKAEARVSNIQFNKDNPVEMLTVPERKVVVETAGSRQDVNSLDKDAIKGLMKTLAPQYGVDWKLVYAIGYHESGNYSSSLARRQNNFFGRKASSGGYASWKTPEDGIKDEFRYLKERYFDRGLTTPATINRVYAEDQTWHYKVEAVMNSVQ